jgi:hypothetical protein
MLYIIASNGKLARQVTTAKRNCSVFWQRKNKLARKSRCASVTALQLVVIAA